MTREQLYSQYEGLVPFYKNIIQLFALSHEEISVDTSYRIFERIRLNLTGRTLRKQEVEFHLKKLEREYFLIPKDINIYSINPEIENFVVRDFSEQKHFNFYVETLRSFLPVFSYSTWANIPLERYYRAVRVEFLREKYTEANRYINMAIQRHNMFDINIPTKVFLEPYDEDWLLKLPYEIAELIVLNEHSKLLNSLSYDEGTFEILEIYNNLKKGKSENLIFEDVSIWKAIFEGSFKLSRAINYQDKRDVSKRLSFDGFINFVEGNYQDSATTIKETIQHFRKESGKRSGFPDYNTLDFSFLASLNQGFESNYESLQKYQKGTKDRKLLTLTLNALKYAQKNDLKHAAYFVEQEAGGVELIFLNYAKYWIFGDDASIDIEYLVELYERAEKYKLYYLQFLIADILVVGYQNIDRNKPASNYRAFAKTLQTNYNFTSIVHLIPKVEPWERAIGALLTLSNQLETGQISIQKEKRLIWLVNFNTEVIEAKEQKITKNGSWSKGRTVAPDRLSALAANEDYLIDKDRNIINAIFGKSQYYYSVGLTDEVLRALVGHPDIYLDNKQRTALEFAAEQPQLVVEDVNDKYELKFNVPVNEIGVHLIKETPTRYKVIEIKQEHLNIANAIGSDKIRLPKSEEEKLSKIVKGFSKVVNVQSELLSEDIDVRKVDANPITHVHLLPLGDGFQLEMYVKPFGEFPPYYKPGEGGKVIITEINGERVQTERDLEEEVKIAKNIIKSCEALGNARKLSKIWEFDTAEECLEILSELQPLKLEDKVIVEWPKGERLKLKGSASFDNLSMNIKGSTDWFEGSGTLKVGEDLVMNMKELLGLLKNNESRFIKLQNGEFLALTNRFRQQLQTIEAYSDVTKEGFKFHPLAAFAMEELTSEARELETDSAFKAQLKKLKDAENIKIKVPSTFKAELRPYQKDGFNWLMKLASWDVGACLADDMGLGKTIQALAAILARAKGGPALVICPASVRINWEREAHKFAPTLNPIQFGVGDRKAILDGLKPYDLLIMSYGLMTTEEEELIKVKFSTIVLDEAQAIKNRSAKRSKSAMALDGDFKVITTGTPIENHLGELWNLFRFINPGLLGSMDRFRDRFAIPIEKYGDDVRREQLKKLIRPFILRRRKSEVLLELPEKTEIVLSVELSPQEKAFYEALRQSAMEKLAEVNPGEGQSHLKILAEITRLRQACCNPKLVQKNTPVKSSKLELFNETIDDLIENGHKVLVFSQFVQHLKILEESLNNKNISYQYLDGSTSQKKRQIAIDAFQAGDGDVFLISLKAGGVGLNLTAADYVIHMDPWWNPAVEDQASDRAHRMGQKRPVTIYRMVTEGTIEEKIVKLHGDKRDLADSLLDGTSSANKLNANDLMDLIKEGLSD